MYVFETIEPLQNYLFKAKASSHTIGLVPTMGALHEGHRMLLENSLKDNDITVCSIYVNPIQFNNAADLENYPRPLEADLKLLEEAGCQAVFCPSDATMYPGGRQDLLQLDFGAAGRVLEGQYRPGHFSGVGVVLSKILNIIMPNRVYFGQKDLQQVAVARKLIGDLFFPVELIRVPTVRNSRGLALSSRNSRLSAEEKVIAAHLYQALVMIKDELQKFPAEATLSKNKGWRFLKKQSGLQVEYLEVVDTDDFRIVADARTHREVAVCVAAYVGGVRLIDNMIVD